MTTTTLTPVLKQRFVDNNGIALYQGLLYSYQAGSTTPLVTYKDSTGVAQNTNPITLNTRGEADVWIPPNVAYKFNLTDSAGNQIPGFPIDNVVNSQLITLYGGVDSGVANAYVLNFTANFTAYTDGVIVYWIPSHSNTGASTININGLGIINIQNADGSALLVSEIIANQPAQILIKGGAAVLTTAATTIYGSFTTTWGGFGGSPPAQTTINYRKNGTDCVLILPNTTGTSTSNVLTLSNLPAFLTPSAFSLVSVPMIGLVDNGASLAGGMAQIVSATNSVSFFKDGTGAVWTASGSKGFSGQPQLMYSL